MAHQHTQKGYGPMCQWEMVRTTHNGLRALPQCTHCHVYPCIDYMIRGVENGTGDTDVIHVARNRTVRNRNFDMH